MATQIKDFLTTFADQEQVVPAVDNKGTVTVTMPATANAGDIYPLEAFARDMSDRTVARATKNIMAVEPAIIQPKIKSPRHDSFVLNTTFQVELEPYETTPGYPGNHVSTTYQVTTEPDGAGEVLYEATSTTDLTSHSITLSRELGKEETAYLRVQVEDENLGDSEWSDSHHIVGSYALSPTVILPKNEATVYYKNFTVSCDELKCAGGVIDNHVKTDWEITDIHGNQVIAQSLNNSTNLTSFTFTNASIPPDTWLAVNITYYGEQTGKSKTTKLVIKTSEKEAIITPSVVFPTGYCHPKAFTAILSDLKMVNMEEYELEEARLKITSDKAGNTVLYDSGAKTSTTFAVSFATAQNPGDTVYFWAYEKEELSGLSAWGEPQEVRICRPLAPIITRPDPMEYFVDFPVILDYLRTQGMTSDTQISSDFEIYTDDKSELLDSAYNKTTDMNEWHPSLSEDLMGSYIIVRARQTGEYTGTTDWTEKRVLVHLPMTVFPPTIQTPVNNGWIHPTIFDVVLGPFETENVDRPNHHASQIKITTDANGRDVIFTSSQFSHGDKRHYTVKLAKASLLPTLYISARVEDGFAGWSEWSEAQPLRVTYPVQPTINKPKVNALLGIENILTEFSGYAMQGGVTGVEFEGVKLIFADKANNKILLTKTIKNFGENVVLPEEARNKTIRMTAAFIGKDVLEGAGKTVEFKTRLVSPGYRIDGKATVIGLPDGEPFTIAGRKVFIAVADALFRSGSNNASLMYGTDGIDTDLPNISVVGTHSSQTLPNGTSVNAYDVNIPTEAAISGVVRGTAQSSELNTRSLIVNYANDNTNAAKFCYDTVIGGMHFAHGSLEAMMKVFMRGQYLDERDPTISETSQAPKRFYNTETNAIMASVLTSSEKDATQCWGLEGHAPIDTAYALEMSKTGTAMVVPMLELVIEDSASTPAVFNFTVVNQERLVWSKPCKFKISATSKNPLNPVVKYKLNIEGKQSEANATYGIADFTASTLSEDNLVIKVIAVMLDGTEFEEREFVFPVYMPQLIPVADVIEIQQGKSLAVPFTTLTKNDIHENPIADVFLDTTNNCTVEEAQTNFIVTPKARFNQPCSFTYGLEDSIGVKSKTKGTVTVKVTMLDEAYDTIYHHNEILELLSKEFEPPTPEQIFNTWGRFNNTQFYKDKSVAQGNCLNWRLLNGNKIECTVNQTDSILGFASPITIIDCDRLVTMSSTDGDDDSIYAVIAYARINNVNYSLSARRSGNGNHVSPSIASGFGIVKQVGSSHTLVKAYNGADTKFGSWKNGFTDVHVVRHGDIIKCTCSAFNSHTLLPHTEIEINLANYPELQWARVPRQYGYACYSQSNSSFTDTLEISFGNVLYDCDTGEVWNWNAATKAWEKDPRPVWEVLDYPRYITNPLDGKRYFVDKDRIIPE